MTLRRKDLLAENRELAAKLYASGHETRANLRKRIAETVKALNAALDDVKKLRAEVEKLSQQVEALKAEKQEA